MRRYLQISCLLVTCLIAFFAFTTPRSSRAEEVNPQSTPVVHEIGGVPRLYLPLVAKAKILPTAVPTLVPTPPPGSRAPLTQKDCDSLTSGTGPLRFILSDKKWQQNTTFQEMISYYNMMAGDFEVNFTFFPQRKIYVYDVGLGTISGVCLPEYKKYTGQNNTKLIYEWYGSEPNWQSKLEGHAVSASSDITVTFTLLGNEIMLSEQTWLGARVVGLARLGGKEGIAIANILEVPSGSFAYSLLRAAPGALLTAAPFLMQIADVTNQALRMPATLLNEDGKSIVWLSENVNTGYLICSPDAATLSDQIGHPDSRRVYFNGNGNAGCVISSKAVGNAKPHTWLALVMSAVRATVMEQTDPTKIDELLIEIETMLANTNDETGDIVVLPTPREGEECPRIQVAVMSDLRWDAVYQTVQNFDYRLSSTEVNAVTITDLEKLKAFTEGVLQNIPSTMMEDRYTSYRPRKWGIHEAHLTTALTPNGPADGYEYTLELVCVWNVLDSVTVGYSWYLNVYEGRLHSGVTSTRPDGDDYYDPYEIEYDQYRPTQ